MAEFKVKNIKWFGKNLILVNNKNIKSIKYNNNVYTLLPPEPTRPELIPMLVSTGGPEQLPAPEVINPVVRVETIEDPTLVEEVAAGEECYLIPISEAKTCSPELQQLLEAGYRALAEAKNGENVAGAEREFNLNSITDIVGSDISLENLIITDLFAVNLASRAQDALNNIGTESYLYIELSKDPYVEANCLATFFESKTNTFITIDNSYFLSSEENLDAINLVVPVEAFQNRAESAVICLIRWYNN